ncbi:MAG: redoxin domain-containing protein [Bacteroidaceae bacterium]|nr:redoxin domain-containing protein [Bacteroidaceae bacterium]
MTRNVKWIFVVLLAVSFIFFSFVGKDTPTEGLTIGDKAPTFKICGEKQLVDLKDLKGKYVLLSFWASYDANSRMQNATLSHATSKNNNIEMVSVSFDNYKSVFTETIRMDRITTANCFVDLEGENSEIYRSYRLHKGFKNYLLDENGVIIAKNINAKQLSSYLN